MPASYPGAVKTFTTRSAGQTIEAAHINDLQDEVNAIEAGLLNGTAPLNSSNSTVATLSVAGASTFAARPTMPPPEMALVFLSSTLTGGSTAAGTAVSVTFNAETFVTNSSMHSTASNSERLIPQSTGVYRFTGQLVLAGAPNAASVIQARILDSTGALVAAADVASASHAAAIQVSAVKRFDALGSYVILQLHNLSGGSTLSLSSGAGQTWFSMVKL